MNLQIGNCSFISLEYGHIKATGNGIPCSLTQILIIVQIRDHSKIFIRLVQNDASGVDAIDILFHVYFMGIPG